MCDLCGATSRSAAESKKLKLPSAALPDALENAGGSGDDRLLDGCLACVAALRDALDALITRRLAGGAEAGVDA